MTDRSTSWYQALKDRVFSHVAGIDAIQLSFSASSQWVLGVILAALMFGVAIDLRPADFARVGRKPRAAIVGLLCQFLVLPACTFVLIQIVRPPPSVALGMMLVAACPGGNVSNLIVYLAGGNAALSVSMTAVSSLAATVLTPLNFAFWASRDAETSQFMADVSIAPWAILGTVILLLALPMALGMWAGARFEGLGSRVRRPLRILCGAIFFGLVAAALGKNVQHLSTSLLPIVLLVIAHNAMAFGLANLAGRAARLESAELRTVTIEVGIQNSGLALGIIFTVFEGLGGMAIVAMLWGVWHIIAGSLIASVWGYRGSSVPNLAGVRTKAMTP